MAQRKNYYPHQVSRNERLAFQLRDDQKIAVVSIRGGRGRQKVTKRLNAFLPLCEFVKVRTKRRYNVNWEWKEKAPIEETIRTTSR
jgi:hypothetical protein